MEESKGRYEIKEGSGGAVEKFLGVQFRRYGRKYKLNMQEYANRLVQRYESAVGIKVSNKDVPCTANLYEEADNIRAAEGEFIKLTPKQLKVLQCIVGELLWLSRTVRHDISFATVQIAARTLSWSTKCEEQLVQLMGYLKKHDNLELVFDAEEEDSWKTTELIVDTDASLALPRSQSGILQYLKTKSGKILVIDWISRSQKLAATSSCAAETVAGHEGLMVTIPITAHMNKQSAVHRTDNAAFIHNIKRGYTERLAYLSRALKLRTSFAHDVNENGIIASEYVKTDENKADHFTKVLQRLKLSSALESTSLIAGDRFKLRTAEIQVDMTDINDIEAE